MQQSRCGRPYQSGQYGGGANLGGEHQVELTHVGPVLRSAQGVDNTLVEDNLLQFLKVGTLHSLGIALVQGVALLLMLEHTGVGGAELSLIKGVAKLLGGFLHLLVNLLLVLRNLVLDEVVGAITLLRVTVVDEGVVEGINVAAGLPHGGVHENSGVNADDVVVEQHHGVPPVFLDIVFQFNAVWSVIIDGGEALGIDFRTGEHKAVFLAVAYNLLEYIFCHFS